MLFVVLRQAQTSSSDLVSVLAGMHEDQLYVTSLDAFLEREVTPTGGTAHAGPHPGSGIRFDHVSFSYPGAASPALSDVNLKLSAGSRVSVLGRNGAGKTTLLKLLTGLYRPTSGSVTLDGLALEEWDRATLAQRMSVMFQDFGRYQLLAGENVGIGSPESFEDRARWQHAAREARVDELVRGLPAGYETQLGQWFEGGRELSAGEWQRLALSRLFTRPQADIVILDEPTAHLDRERERQVLADLAARSSGRLSILVSHRATWDDPESLVIVLEAGRVVTAAPRGELNDPAAGASSREPARMPS
jgi:ATP-binding cassette subfamily B protein